MSSEAKPEELDDVLLAFYGDDFTGSTDALEGLAANGVRAVLFLQPPSAEDITEFEEIDAIGIAGASRSMTPPEMEAELRPVFESLADLDPPLVHYKVCSTFDSAPEVGSIGRAIDVGQSVFDSPFVPVSQGTEVPLGRYVVFSNLFAVEGGETYRIDRHPTMADHPVTPMSESDLRRHLENQTNRSISRISVNSLGADEDAEAALETASENGEIVIFDALETDHLARIGRLLWRRAIERSDPLFAVGSSGLEHHALVAAWEKAGLIDRDRILYRKREPLDRIVVVSGSASPTTAAQIEWAAEHGFETVRLDTAGLIDPDAAEEAQNEAVDRAIEVLADGRSIVLYSARGPDDPAIEATRERFEELKQRGALETEASLERRLGRQQGEILADIVEKASIERACVAGGDTSSHAVPQLEARALEAIAPVGPGAPLCRLYSDRSSTDGLEVALKGGQIGTRNAAADYFGAVREGGVDNA